jgi:anti-sigma factor RsiW
MMDQWTNRLSDYLDGELDKAERDALEQHIEECFECRRVLGELRQVVARAAALPDRAPAQDLWAGVAARIGAEPAEGADLKVIDLASRRGVRGARRVSLSLPQLAAASIALMALSGSIVWFALGRNPSAPIATAPSTVRQVSNGTQVVAQYSDALRSLEQALATERDNLDPVTVAILEENLRAIDAAITEARGALSRDPGNLYLNQHLENTMKKKIQLLRTATALRST